MRLSPAVVLFTSLAQTVPLPGRSEAQHPESSCRPLIEAVDTIDDASLLHGTWLERAQNHVDPVLAELVPPFARMRRYELQFRRVDSYEAARAFRRVLRRQPDLACAHYGLGRTLARGPDALVRLGDGPLDHGPVPYSLAARQAPRELTRALELDSALVEAAAELYRLAVAMRHDRVTDAAREALALVPLSLRGRAPLILGVAELDALEGAPDSASRLLSEAETGTWMPRHREQAAAILLDTGHPEAAAELLDPYGDETGVSGRSFYLRARVLLVTPGRESEGAVAYLRGLAQTDSAGLETYLLDIEPLLGDVVASWREQGADATRENLRWWWERSAALSGLAIHERLAEHYRRLTLARREFPLRSSLGAPLPNALILDPAWRRFRIDQRGLVYLRQGEPALTFGGTAAGSSSVTWIYGNIDGGSAIYHFTKQPGQPDWEMIPVGCQVSPSLRQTLVAWDPEIALSLSACEAGGAAALEDRLRARQKATRAWTTEADRRHLDGQPEFSADFYALRGRTATVLTAVVGIDAASLRAGGPEQDPAYASRVDLILIDSTRRAVERAGQDHSLRPGRPLSALEVVRFHVTAEIPSSEDATYRVVVTDMAGGSSNMAGGSIEIPDFRSGGLQISDLVLATADTGTWRRGAVSLSLVPGRVFPVGEPMHVYFEIYDQPAGAAFGVEISLRTDRRRGILGRIAGLFRGARTAATLRFDDNATESDPVLGIPQLRSLGTADLEPGEYSLTVTITDRATGASSSRTRTVTLRAPPDPGGE